MRAHLPGCPACAAELASLAELPALLDLAAPLARPTSRCRPPPRRRCSTASPASREAARGRRARAAAPPRLPRIAWTRPRVAVASAAARRRASRSPRCRRSTTIRRRSRRASRNYVVQLKPGAGRAAERVAAASRSTASRAAPGVHLWASGLQPRPKHVYEVLCEKGGWSASAGTFRADANGRVEARLTTAARVGEYDRLRVVYQGSSADTTRTSSPGGCSDERRPMRRLTPDRDDRRARRSRAAAATTRSRRPAAARRAAPSATAPRPPRAARTSRSPPTPARAQVRQERADRQGRQGHDHDGQPVRHRRTTSSSTPTAPRPGETVGKGEKSDRERRPQGRRVHVLLRRSATTAREGMEGKLTVK